MEALATYYEQQFNSNQTLFPAWFAAQQAQAFADYLEQGLPTRKTEQWKYNSLEKLKKNNFLESELSLSEINNRAVIEITDGVLSLAENLPAGVKVLKLSDALEQYQETCQELFSNNNSKSKTCFENINLALLDEGLFFHIEKNTKVTEPLQIIIKNTKNNLNHHLHNVFFIEEGSQVDIIEKFVGDDDCQYFNNHISQILVKSNAHASYIKLIEEGSASHHISKLNIFQQADSKVDCHSFALNGGLVRSDIETDLLGGGSHVTMNGLYLTSGSQQVSHYTKVNHLRPHATSDEFYKGILGGKSKATFNGTVFVAKDAQKTNASQQNKNLLLSDHAQINTKPQLEIYADDVKCAHGATVGQLEDKALFYLQSRGIAKNDAIVLLVNAFAGDLIDKLKTDQHLDLKESLHNSLEQRLREFDNA